MLLECRRASAQDFPALEQLLELYQYELSDIWEQELDARGRYGYDLARHHQGQGFFAHMATVNGHWAGFALVAPACVTRTQGCWMEQFFVLKKHRRCGVGQALVQHVFTQHRGLWEVGQMPANLVAQGFWRQVIGSFSGGAFTELQVSEGWWQGVVQCFDSGAAP